MSDPAVKNNNAADEASKPKLAPVQPFNPSAQTDYPSVSKKSRWIFYFKIMIGIVIGIATFEFSRNFIYNYLKFESTDDAQVSAHSSVLNAKVGGIVAKVYFGDNAKVKKGDIIAAIDDREYVIAIKQLESELKAAQAKYWFAITDYQRGKYLFKVRAIPKRRLDEDKALADETLALYWAKNAQIDQAKLNLEFTDIRAPADGVIGKIFVEPGLVIRPQQAITNFVDYRNPWIVANFKETQLQNVRIGQRAEVEIDLVDNKTFIGQVESISPGSGASFSLIPPDNATGNFTKIVQRVAVKIDLDPLSIRGFESYLVPGTSAFVKVRVRSDKSSP